MGQSGEGRGRGEWTGISIGGIVLIVIGSVLLVDRLGIFHFAWDLFWPLILIVVGALVLASAAGWFSSTRPATTPAAGSSIVTRNGAGRLELEVGVGGGTFRLAGGATELVEVRSSATDIAVRQRREGDLAQVRVRQDVASFGAWRGETSWQIQTASEIPTRLRFDAGAGTFDLDLSAIPIVEARLQVGAARARIVLPRAHGTVVVTITGGAASFSIEVPAGVEYRFDSSGGLTSVDGRTESPGYHGAADRVQVRFTGGAASVRIG